MSDREPRPASASVSAASGSPGRPRPAPEDSHPAPVAYEQALRYLAGHPDLERGALPPHRLGLDGIRRLLAALGRPDRRYPSVLIAGTKGKGSTAAMIERALRAAGYRTGLYTQPHLHTLRERVRLDGEPIAPEDFAEGMDRARRAAEAVAPYGAFTAYELTTALALERFAAHAVDVAVLEVGLGGRLDATNAVDADVSVLTSISLDHTQILGDTVEAIAREKADIIKAGRPAVSAPQPPGALAVIRAVAAQRRAQLLVAGQPRPRWERQPSGVWDLIAARGRLEHVRLALRGGFQRVNAAVAAAALDALAAAGLSVPASALRAGLEQVEWPGRFEWVAGPSPLVLDGAHNVESAQRLREAVAEELPGRAPVYVLGIASDKDIPGIAQSLCAPSSTPELAPPPRLVVATAARHPRAERPETIAAAVRATGARAEVSADVAQAVVLAQAGVGQNEIVVVTGSLYAVAEARAALGLDQAQGEPAFDPWAAP